MAEPNLGTQDYDTRWDTQMNAKPQSAQERTLWSGGLPTVLRCVALVSLCVLPSGLVAQTGREVARRAFPSVVLLVMQDENGQPLSLGSGFFVTDGVVATNLHVVSGASSGRAKIVGQARTYAISGVVAVDTDADLVLLELSDAKAPVLQLAEATDLAVGDVVYAVGSPEESEGSFSQGIVSGIRNMDDDKLLQITAPILPSSSGGPILDSRGQVVGVAVATFSGGQNLNFAIPSSNLASLLKHVEDSRSLSAVTEIQDADSLVSPLGDRSANAVIGVEFTWDHADYPMFGDPFSFTLRNQLTSPVTDVHYLVVFLGIDSKAVGYFDGLTCPGDVIPGNSAKRQAKAFWSREGNDACTEIVAPESLKKKSVQTVQVRVLNFKLVTSNQTDANSESDGAAKRTKKK